MICRTPGGAGEAVPRCADRPGGGWCPGLLVEFPYNKEAIKIYPKKIIFSPKSIDKQSEKDYNVIKIRQETILKR